LRQGARTLLAQAVEAEIADFLAKHADLKTEDGRQRTVRHRHLPEREVMTGIGPVDVLVRRFDRRGLFGVLLALPLTAGLAWYSFDCLTPTGLNLGINTSQTGRRINMV
jgi:hypothetical protein